MQFNFEYDEENQAYNTDYGDQYEHDNDDHDWKPFIDHQTAGGAKYTSYRHAEHDQKRPINKARRSRSRSITLPPKIEEITSFTLHNPNRTTVRTIVPTVDHIKTDDDFHYPFSIRKYIQHDQMPPHDMPLFRKFVQEYASWYKLEHDPEIDIIRYVPISTKIPTEVRLMVAAPYIMNEMFSLERDIESGEITLLPKFQINYPMYTDDEVDEYETLPKSQFKSNLKKKN